VKLQFKKRRLIPVALAILVLVVGSGVAYAYWTSGGSGTGAGTAAGGVSVTVNQTTSLTGMYPGQDPQALAGNFTNATGASVFVTTVTVSIDPVTPVSGNPGTCDATDFALASATATVNAQVPVGSPELTVTWSGPTIQFVNKPLVDQNGCKGATVNLVYSIP
jgi:Flp pilus assembly protein TadG